MMGGERLDQRHPLVEREANLFAAEILMPRRQVSSLFTARHGSRVHPDDIDEKLAFTLSLGSSTMPSPELLRSMSRRERARLIAKDTSGGLLLPLTEFFGVSETAMAIRLEELDLVF